MSETPSTPAVLSPSELVLLFGDRFAPEAGMLAGKEEVLSSGAKVHAQKLMDAACAAALLAVHRSGAARLEERTGSRLFGLLKKQTLHLVKGAGASAFPEGSLEHALVGWSAGGPEVWEALARWMGEETNDVPGQTLGAIKAGLAGRGLLAVQERKALGVFTVSSYTLPDATRSAAAALPLEPVHDLLRQAEQREAGLWKAIGRAIDAARIHLTPIHND